MTHLFADLRHGFRGLWKAPLFTALAVTSLGLGLGANTAIFTLLDQIMLRPLPVERPHELVHVQFDGDFNGTTWGDDTVLSYPMYLELRDRNEVFSGMFARFAWPMHVSTATGTERLNGELVSGTYFPVLGLQAAHGRLLTPEDDRTPASHPVAVLGHRYWTTRLGANPAIVGQTITVNQHPLVVVGVAEPGFDGIDVGRVTDVFVPMMMKVQMTPGWSFLDDRRGRFAMIFGRLRPGITRERAEAGLQPLFRAQREQELTDSRLATTSAYGKAQFLRAAIRVAPGFQGTSQLRSDSTRPLWILMAIAGGVLLIACANVAGLLLARGMTRQREVAIRLALGGGRRRVLQQLLAESFALALVGAAAGLLVATWGSAALLGFFVEPETAASVSGSFDARIFLFTFGLTLLTGLACGVVPAIQATRPALVPALKEQAGTIAGGGTVRLRKMLVVAQVALSLLLLVGAGLFIGSLRNLLSQDPGFRTSHVVSFIIEPSLNGYPVERTKLLTKSLVERLGALPGVRSASASLIPLLMGGGWSGPMTVEGYTAAEGESVEAFHNPVLPGYFATIGIPLLRGRDFTPNDAQAATPGPRLGSGGGGGRRDYRVAIANQKFVEKYLGGKDPIGRHVGFGVGAAMPIEIVGVVGTSKLSDLRREAEAQLFYPYMESTSPILGNAVIYVRTTRPPETMFGALRQALKESDPNLPMSLLRTMDEQVNRSLVNERLIAGLAAVFGLLATLLAVVGLYGVMAYTVAQRTREVGIRMALGARAEGIGWLFFREAAILVLAGFAVAMPLLWTLAGYVRAQLHGIDALSPPTVAIAMIGLGLVAALGALVPARRAARIEPLRALRHQ